MKALGRNPTEKDIEDIYKEYDVDHNGKIDFNG
jgi:Ca2+-binding EF-hand superfamily protein